MTAQARPDPEAGRGERESGEVKGYLLTLFAVYASLMFTAFALAVWALRFEGDFATAAAAVGATFLLVPAMEVVAKRDDRLHVTQHRRAFLQAFGLAMVVAALLWAVSLTLPEDVTNRAELNGGDRLGAGNTAELVVNAEPDGHDELSVTLLARDENTGGGTSCIPVAELKFGGEDLAGTRTVELRNKLTAVLPLDDAGPGVTVDISLIAAADCRVTLSLEQAGYR